MKDSSLLLERLNDPMVTQKKMWEEKRRPIFGLGIVKDLRRHA